MFCVNLSAKAIHHVLYMYLSRRDDVTKDDPACEHHLYWSEPPERVLVIKKFRDLYVTAKFKELTTWLVKVTIFDLLVDIYSTVR